jgi:uncharacterized protein YecE (DUF72 family)
MKTLSWRALRRQKQREENPVRARETRKKRLSFRPPSQAENPPLPKYNVGCSGWYYRHWQGTFYPARIPTSQWFKHYQKHFHTVELNAPFYSWPTVATVKSWLRQAQRENFVYTVKVCELITHVKRFQGTKTLIADFCFIADLLGPHMGCFLFQLPPAFQYTPARLRNILSQLGPTRRNVLEFRHESWWNKTVCGALRKAGVIFCSSSAPKLPSSLVKTADEIYIRFHGTEKWYRHDYPPQELKEWAKRIQASKAKRVWVYFNNDQNAFAVKNARALAGYLAETAS